MSNFFGVHDTNLFFGRRHFRCCLPPTEYSITGIPMTTITPRQIGDVLPMFEGYHNESQDYYGNFCGGYQFHGGYTEGHHCHRDIGFGARAGAGIATGVGLSAGTAVGLGFLAFGLMSLFKKNKDKRAQEAQNAQNNSNANQQNPQEMVEITTADGKKVKIPKSEWDKINSSNKDGVNTTGNNGNDSGTNANDTGNGSDKNNTKTTGDNGNGLGIVATKATADGENGNKLTSVGNTNSSASSKDVKVHYRNIDDSHEGFSQTDTTQTNVANNVINAQTLMALITNNNQGSTAKFETLTGAEKDKHYEQLANDYFRDEATLTKERFINFAEAYAANAKTAPAIRTAAPTVNITNTDRTALNSFYEGLSKGGTVEVTKPVFVDYLKTLIGEDGLIKRDELK